MTCLTTGAFRQLSTKPFLNQLTQPIFQGIESYQLDDIVGKREHQQHASFGLGNTARPHIKQGILVELTDRGSMTTLHVVCINFELRFRVHFSERRCTQILITLIGFGFLRPMSNQYAPAERTSRRIIQHLFEQLITLAKRNGIIYMRIRIDDLFFIGDSHTA